MDFEPIRPMTNLEKYRRAHPKEMTGRPKRIPGALLGSNRRPYPLTCHLCATTWDSKNKCFVCPKCHTVFNPLKSPKAGIGGELRMARIRMNLSTKELARIIGISEHTIQIIESGKHRFFTRPAKVTREKVRIWIESTKSPIDRRKEIDEMFREQK